MSLRKTCLHDLIVANGGRMVGFSGWEMPVQFSGIIDEHLAVRRRAGLFDVSHMGQFGIRGPGSGDLLQRLTTNDV
ncbi:MAG: glycine cleavage system aminomethyltransferase GcvT, partial [Acidobacteriota bacterium]